MRHLIIPSSDRESNNSLFYAMPRDGGKKGINQKAKLGAQRQAQRGAGSSSFNFIFVSLFEPDVVFLYFFLCFARHKMLQSE